jgi:hypothetical protein
MTSSDRYWFREAPLSEAIADPRRAIDEAGGLLGKDTLIWHTEPMLPACWNIAGLLSSLVGVLLLFLFGMPFRVRTGGAIAYIANHLDENEKRKEKIYDALGYLGVALVVVGTLCQIKASL